MVRIMLGTTPNLPRMALNMSLFLPEALSGLSACRRVIIFCFGDVVIDDTKVNDTPSPWLQNFQPKECLSRQSEISNDIFLIIKGTSRSLIIDHTGEEHTIRFHLSS